MDLLNNIWFVKLKNDYNNKYLNFCSQSKNLKIVKSSIVDLYQYFDVNNALGWIIFPYKCDCCNLPSIQTEIIFPKANYKSNTSNDLIPFGILSVFDKSNESLLIPFIR